MIVDSAKEIIGVELEEALETGSKYFITFQISAGSNLISSPCYCNKIGVKFFRNIKFLANFNAWLIDDHAHIFEDSIMTDTTNWNLFQGSFIADSAYKAILIGNFFNLININYTCLRQGALAAYYYFDRFCVSTDSLHCARYSRGLPLPNQNPPDAYQISFIDNEIQIFLESDQQDLMVIIFDTAGRMIFKNQLRPGINKINYYDFASGMYLLRIGTKTYKFIR
ncbi:MAG: T9SS C-terminal target domain-containing protein [Bacteroidetes bacterium]|nr:MAG: T9SS C-terminal target domain-containing protein [Bacteroidota bacterium]REK05050.1 MAG: T9SS C-terminal target domain-containing protein [Bacteroidota bacterium]REK36449.1 MAG: T9SS C-terminal target domain-containing protein [Bacteroidota bacterium]REK51663.1 MAG: T9SS C-terminal target domain-containing protein [Bacteroidota bacterium]